MTLTKRKSYILMTLLSFSWGIDYIMAKNALTIMDPLTLMLFRYTFTTLVMIILKQKLDRKTKLNKRHLLLFIVSVLVGDIMYFGFEYKAMDYIEIPLITIVLATIPGLTLIIEHFGYKRHLNKYMLLGTFLSIVGVAIVISGESTKDIFQGRAIGYLFAFGAVFAWIAYNFVTESFHGKYSTIGINYYQVLIATLILTPYGLFHLPKLSEFTPVIIGSILYLALISGVLGFLIYISSLDNIGVTSTSVFSNLLPVTSTFFAWIILGETLTFVQLIGSAIVISSAYIVIYQKHKAHLE